MFYHALTGNGGTAPTGDLEPVLLWENSNPTAAFAAQTISLDLTDYAGVLVEFERNKTINDIVSRAYIKKDDYNVTNFGAGYSGTTSAAGRSVKVDNNGVIFGNGNTTEEDNTTFIPVKIYGVKSYVVGVKPLVQHYTYTGNGSSSKTIELTEDVKVLVIYRTEVMSTSSTSIAGVLDLVNKKLYKWTPNVFEVLDLPDNSWVTKLTSNEIVFSSAFNQNTVVYRYALIV